MSDWVYLESVEGLESSSTQPGALWELLQGEKERVCSEISEAGALVHDDGFAANEHDPSDEYFEVIDWHHRNELENRLRHIIDAQDRLLDGSDGRCAYPACGKPDLQLRTRIARGGQCSSEASQRNAGW